MTGLIDLRGKAFLIPDFITAPPSLAKSETPRLETNFGVHFIRTLTGTEAAKRKAMLLKEHALYPNPFIKPSNFGLSPDAYAACLPVLRFTAQEVVTYLRKELAAQGITTLPPFLTGGGMRHALQDNYAFNDLDINWYLENARFDLIWKIVRHFIVGKLVETGAALKFTGTTAYPTIEDLVAYFYLYRRKLISKEDQIVASFIGLETLEFKFIASGDYRYHVCKYDKFLLSLESEALYFVRHAADFKTAEHEEAWSLLTYQKFEVEHPEQLTDLFFRVLRTVTQGFEITSQGALIHTALRQFCLEYPLSSSKKLIHKIHHHLHHQSAKNPFGRLIDFLNLVTLLSFIECQELRAAYIRLTAQAWLTDGSALGVLPKSFSLFSFSTLFLKTEPMHKEIAESKSPEKEDLLSALAQLVCARPELGEAAVHFVQGAACLTAFLETGRLWTHPPEIMRIGEKGAPYFLLQSSLELDQLAMHALKAWTLLEAEEKLAQELLSAIGMKGAAFNPEGKKQWLQGWMKMLKKPSARLTQSAELLECIAKEAIPLFSSEQHGIEQIEQWHFKAALKHAIKALPPKHQALPALQVIFYRINTCEFALNPTYLGQLQVRLQELTALEVLNDKPALSKALAQSITHALLKTLHRADFKAFQAALPVYDAALEMHLFSSAEKRRIESALATALSHISLPSDYTALLFLSRWWNKSTLFERESQSPEYGLEDSWRGTQRIAKFALKLILEKCHPNISLKEETATYVHFSEVLSMLALKSVMERDLKAEIEQHYIKLLNITLRRKHLPHMLAAGNLALKLAGMECLGISTSLYSTSTSSTSSSSTESSSMLNLCSSSAVDPLMHLIQGLLGAEPRDLSMKLLLMLPLDAPNIDVLLFKVLTAALADPNFDKALIIQAIDKIEALPNYPHSLGYSQAKLEIIPAFRKILKQNFSSRSLRLRAVLLYLLTYSLPLAQECLSLVRGNLMQSDGEAVHLAILEAHLAKGSAEKIRYACREWLTLPPTAQVGYLALGQRVLAVVLQSEDEISTISQVVEKLYQYMEKNHLELSLMSAPTHSMHQTHQRLAATLDLALDFLQRRGITHVAMRLFKIMPKCAFLDMHRPMPLCMVKEQCEKGVLQENGWSTLEKILRKADAKVDPEAVFTALLAAQKILRQADGQSTQRLYLIFQALSLPSRLVLLTTEQQGDLCGLMKAYPPTKHLAHFWEHFPALHRDPRLCTHMLESAMHADIALIFPLIAKHIASTEILTTFPLNLAATSFYGLTDYFLHLCSLENSKETLQRYKDAFERLRVQAREMLILKCHGPLRRKMGEALITYLLKIGTTESYSRACRLFYPEEGRIKSAESALHLVKAIYNYTKDHPNELKSDVNFILTFNALAKGLRNQRAVDIPKIQAGSFCLDHLATALERYSAAKSDLILPKQTEVDLLQIIRTQPLSITKRSFMLIGAIEGGVRGFMVGAARKIVDTVLARKLPAAVSALDQFTKIYTSPQSMLGFNLRIFRERMHHPGDLDMRQIISNTFWSYAASTLTTMTLRLSLLKDDPYYLSNLAGCIAGIASRSKYGWKSELYTLSVAVLTDYVMRQMANWSDPSGGTEG